MKTLCLLLVLASGCATRGLPNFDVVAPGIYRGGQPTAEGWRTLERLGVKVVVKLNRPSEGDDDASPIPVLRYPMPPSSLSERSVRPNIVAVALAVASLEPGVYVHCTHGQDRTGLVVGVYRVLREGWSKDRARREMIDHGFHRVLWRGLDDFWREWVPER